MLRRLHHDQPEGFEFTPDNLKWAEGQITKYPEGRQASAIIPLLWRAQEQEGWLSRPAIEYVCDMLGLAHIRGLEVATFYFMFQLQPVGSVAHIQVCGTTSCMICGAEDLIAVCKDKIAPKAHQLSADGKFSWEEVECLGACANAPMAQIGKDYYEDLTEARLAEIIDEFAAGKVPTPGPQNGRFTSEPAGGLTSLTEYGENRQEHNGSVALAVKLGDTVKKIDGTEVPILTPWVDKGAGHSPGAAANATGAPRPKPAHAAKAEAEKAKTGAAKTTAAASTAEPTADEESGGARAPDGVKETETAEREKVADKAPPPKSEEAKAHEHEGKVDPEADETAKGAAGSNGTAEAKGDVPADSGDAAEGEDDSGSVQVTTSKGEAGTKVDPDAPATASGLPEGTEERQPETLDAPREGGKDDLKRIKGVGPKLEEMLNSMGIWHFDQIAAWGNEEIAWVDARLRFKGRIVRDDWVSKARDLSKG